jgi:hypothetical protein
MRATRRSHTTLHAIKKLLLLFIFGLVVHLLHVDTPSTVMGATTHSKITRGKAPTPSSSPRLDINHLIGEINLPGERYDSVLQVLQPRYSTLDNPEVNPEKGSQMTAPDLPTGVNSQAGAPGALDDATPPQDNSTA